MAWSASIECEECGGIAGRETIYAVLNNGTNIWITIYYCRDCGWLTLDDWGTISGNVDSKHVGARNESNTR